LQLKSRNLVYYARNFARNYRERPEHFPTHFPSHRCNYASTAIRCVSYVALRSMRISRRETKWVKKPEGCA